MGGIVPRLAYSCRRPGPGLSLGWRAGILLTTVLLAGAWPLAAQTTWTSIAAGGMHTCAVPTGGRAHCWGYNGWGQLGDGTQLDRYVPVPVASSVRFRALAGGDEYTCGVRSDSALAPAGLSAHAASHRFDTTRVVLAGFSMGGDLSWAIALRNPQRFRGAIVMGSRAGYRARPQDHRALVEHGARFFFTMGEHDEEARVTGARAAAQFLERLSVPHLYREIPGAGHESAPLPMFAEAPEFVLRDR